MVENILHDISDIGLDIAILRSFNVCGAEPRGGAGQRQNGQLNLIKLACEVAASKRAALTVFGTDYETPDGTCVRDFIHVSDLAEIYLLTLFHLQRHGGPLLLNCGTSVGRSVFEVLSAVEQVSGRRLPTLYGARRSGDLASAVACNQKIVKTLGWQPRYRNIKDMVQTAFDWESARSVSQSRPTNLAGAKQQFRSWSVE